MLDKHSDNSNTPTTRVFSYSRILDILSDLDEVTQGKYTKSELLDIIYEHLIDKGIFQVYNAWGTVAVYQYKAQKRDFIKFINLQFIKHKL